MPRQTHSEWRGRPLILGLQGGGSFGAFTWGVLDAVLDAAIPLEAVSGASAGALNAVILAEGLRQGGRAVARKKLARFWRRVSNAFPLSGTGLSHLTLNAMEIWQDAQPSLPPMPGGAAYLAAILEDEVDFAALRRASPVGLFISATRAHDGVARVFRSAELTVEVVLASVALPRLGPPVEIEGTWYWDGGMSANPPLADLVASTTAADLLIVELSGGRDADLPGSAREARRQLQTASFRSAFARELDTLCALRRLCHEEGAFRSAPCRRLRDLALHRLSAAETLDDLGSVHPLNADWTLLSDLKDAGVKSAKTWIAAQSSRQPEVAEAAP